MKKLLLILFCLPVIGLGQITIQETKSEKYLKIKKNINSPFDQTIETGLIIQTGTQIFQETVNFTIFYFNYNINYDISLNNNYFFYNQLSLSVKYRNRKELIENNWEASFPMKIWAKFDYSGGLKKSITKELEHSLGVTITLIPLFGAVGVGNWGGFNYELDYLISDKLCSTISLGRVGNVKQLSGWGWEILFGITYKL